MVTLTPGRSFRHILWDTFALPTRRVFDAASAADNAEVCRRGV